VNSTRPTPAGRFAPSPTGELHLGNIRTAVLAWLFARSTGRRFLLRIEDLDAGRVRPGLAEQQAAELTALGVEFDDPMVVQSDRGPAYAAALASLAGRTYECYCTRREIAEAASAPHDAPLGYRRYPGTCRHLTANERAARRAERPPALRLCADDAEFAVSDLLHGEVGAVVDDIVLRRNDGVAAYNLAVVVDDLATGVDQVVRGADLLASAVNQAYLTRLLGAAPPTYAHVPLAVNRDGHRLAKRDGAVTMASLAARGTRAEQVLGRIAHSLGLAAADEPVVIGDLLDRFDPSTLPRDPWVVDG
jgi:glutamyl-tRNA synthetase